MSFGRLRARAVHVIVPFYKNPGLVAPLFQSLFECAKELNDLGCTVVAINDSPDNRQLSAELNAAAARLRTRAACAVIQNEKNLGFLKSVNCALRQAVDAGADVILLNSDTIVFPGALSEIRRVAYLDPMTGFVSPRSNNATICSLPQQASFHHAEPDEAYEAFRAISGYLPPYHYAPTAVGFCLFIKFDMLNEFGFFDERYGKGYNEENDLIMRANRCGFRAVLANHAFVHHIGEQSFAASDVPKSIHEEQNSRLLIARYPEYPEQVAKYQSSASYEAERLLTGLSPDNDGRLDVLFDCSYFGTHHNGTFMATRQIIKHAAKDWRDKFNIFVMASSAAAEFHGFNNIPGVVVVPVETSNVFGVAFRFGQPFDLESILRLGRLAPVNVYGMLDTIAWDCLYLNRDNLDELWRTVAQYADGILYISDLSCDQFRRRFPVRAGMAEKTSYLSLTPCEYVADEPGSDAVPQNGSWLLVVGNKFLHKNVGPTVKAISGAFPRARIVALGELECPLQNVTTYTSGQLSDGAVRGLFAGARAVVFPSTYEGFGMPVMEALSCKRKVFVRDNPLNRAMHERLGRTRNLVLYDSTSSLLDLLAREDAATWVKDLDPDGGQHSWACHTRHVRELLEMSLARFSYQGTLMPRLWFSRTAADSQRPVLAAIAERESRIAGLTHEIESLRKALDDREVRIRELLMSASWTITAPLRGIARLWMKPRR
jgi:GT2 family glycosyltransferase